MVRRTGKAAIIAGAAVFSHWILDLVTHRPDLPVIPGMDTFVGLGLWNSLIGSIIVEGGIYIAAIAVYTRATNALNRKGKYGFWSLVILFALIWLINFFSPPPPSETAVAVAGLFLWFFVPWGYWIDRNRQ